MKKERKMKKWIHTPNPLRFPRFTVVVVTFFVKKTSTICMILFRNVSLSRGKSTTRFAVLPIFRRKVTIFIGRETKIHIFRRKSTKKIDQVCAFINNYSLRFISPINNNNDNNNNNNVSHPTSRVSPCVFCVVSVLISLHSQHLSQTHQRIRVGSSRVPKRAHVMHTVEVSSNMVAEHGWSWEQISERICEQIADVHASQVVEQIIEVPKMAEQILDVLVLETMKQSVKMPSTVSEDRIQQRTAEHITVIPVP